MKFHIAVNRSDAEGWKLWDNDYCLSGGYASFSAATGNKSYLTEQYPNLQFKVIGIDF